MAKTEQLCVCSRFAPISEAAALAAADWVGRGDGLSADKAAREAMAAAVEASDLQARVVGGRVNVGAPTAVEADEKVEEATAENGVLAADEAVGEMRESWDLAVTPLEGHRGLARGLDGALAMLAAGPSGTIMAVPEMYMQKIAVSTQAAGAIDMYASVTENVCRVAEALGKQPRDLNVVVLDRPRHEELIEQVKSCGARLKLIDDGDVSASIAAAVPDTDVDLCIGIGGATEGIITAAALRCLGGAMQARFWPVSRFQVEKIRGLGIDNVETVLTIDDMAKEGVLLAVTAVTKGRFLRGVEMRSDGIRTETMVMCSHCHKISMIKTIHRQEQTQPTPSLWTL